MRSPPRTERPRYRRSGHQLTHPSTRRPTVDLDGIQATIAHLRRALTASITSDAAGVKASLLRTTRTTEGIRHPDIAAAIRAARGVDPVSRTVRQYIRALLRRLVVEINCWEPPR